MGVSTGEVVRRFRDELPPLYQKMLSVVALPGPGPQGAPAQLGAAARIPAVAARRARSRAVYVGCSDADSIPDRNIFRWLADDVLTTGGSLAYQGVTLSLANFARLDVRGRTCAIQQSSIFIRVSIARLINEARRRGVVRAALARARRGWRGSCARCSSSASGARRSASGTTRSCGSTRCRRSGSSRPSGATEDSTLGYALGARGVVMKAAAAARAQRPAGDDRRDGPAERALVQGRARRRELPLARVARAAHRVQPRAARAPRRQQGDRVADRRRRVSRSSASSAGTSRIASPTSPSGSCSGIAFPSISLGLTIWVGGIVTQDLIESLAPYYPRPVTSPARSLKAKFFGIFRCQTYWLLATRGAWRVLWAQAREGRFEPAKTDRVTRATRTDDSPAYTDAHGRTQPEARCRASRRSAIRSARS